MIKEKIFVHIPTDSCSSYTDSRKAKRTVETSTATAEIALQTTPNDTMTEPTQTIETSTLDKILDGYKHIEACEGIYKTDYCFNGGTCYVHKYGEAEIFACECTSHFNGLRCLEKQPEGSYGGGMKIRRSGRGRRRIPSRMSDCRKVFLLWNSVFDELKHRAGFHANPSLVDGPGAPPKKGRKPHHAYHRFNHRFTSTSAP